MSERENHCSVQISQVEPCGRPIYSAPDGVDETPVCLMHSEDPNKGASEFAEEIKAILNGTAHDFQGFVFPTYDYSFLTFSGNASFEEARFAAGSDFTMARFGEKANFFKAQFGEGINFFGAKFSEGASFFKAEFGEGVEFRGAEFGEGVEFSWAKFAGDATFEGAKFGDGANFFFAKFGGGVNFRLAKFGEGASFWRAEFGGGANFFFAKFGDGAEFMEAKFGEGVNFTMAEFGGKTDFSETTLPGVTSFRRVTFENPAQVRFYRVNQKHQEGFRVRFLSCDMREVIFEDVHWHRQNHRMVLQDELDVIEGEAKKGKNKEENPTATATATEEDSRNELVAVTYRRLIHNFERVRAYDLAEDCYVGAMNMKRLDPKVSFFQRCVTTFYQWASNYGSSYGRALSVLGLMSLVFSAIFLFTGFKEVDSDSSPIEYNLSYRPPPVGRVLEDSAKAFVFTSSIATFQRTRFYEPVGLSSQFWVTVATLLLTTQMALVILALRRRFKR